MLDFDAQCCDANDYLSLGSHCAAGGSCVNDLRPLGSVYWFAWPEYLGLQPTAVLYLGLVLLAISVLLSALVLQRALKSVVILPRAILPVLLLISAGIHYAFFQPVLWVSLSDAPAGLCALIGMWLLLLSWPASSWRLALGLTLSGLLLGTSAWIRAFNLYPVLVVLLVYVIAWCCRKERRFAELLLLFALIPIAVQYAAIRHYFDGFSFISPNSSSSWTKTHLGDEAIGYDTVMPHTGLRYFSHCPREGGLLGAIERRDLRAYICVLANRVNFYWGSDMRYTYIEPKNPSNLLIYPERIDEAVFWLRPGIVAQPDSVLAPNGRIEAEALRMEPEHFNPLASKEVFTGVSIPKPGVYSVSAWIWSPKSKYVDLLLLNRNNEHVLEQRLLLTTEPTRYEFSTNLVDDYALVMVRASGGANESLGSEVDDSFSVWGVQLEAGETASDYSLAIADESNRQYSAILLGANVLLCLLAIGLLFHRSLRTVPYVMVALFAVLSFGQALIIVPEQRFIIVPQVIMWLFGLTTAASFLLRRREKISAELSS